MIRAAALSLALLAAPAMAAEPLSALAPQNLARPRPKAPIDLTGTWKIVIEPSTGGFNFAPLPKLKPHAQAMYEAGIKANAEGKAYRDDTGACWPAGMPKIMTRVWPVQIIQTPTVIIMIQELMNSVRWIYMDGRSPPDPDIYVPQYNGYSIGHWEGKTLVIETGGFEASHHWIQQGIPVSDKFHITERISLTPDGQAILDEFTFTDPETWEGKWMNTKRLARVNADLMEVHCLPNTNDDLPGTQDSVRTDK
jgi:hypothetical protein